MGTTSLPRMSGWAIVAKSRYSLIRTMLDVITKSDIGFGRNQRHVGMARQTATRCSDDLAWMNVMRC